MIAKCARCQYVFTTERYGKQFCPSCGAELLLPEPPGAPASPSSPFSPPPPDNAPSPAAPSPVEPSGPGPSGARCAAHPERVAAGVCARCGAFACPECLQPEADGSPRCLACRERGEALARTPWEERDKRGFFVGFYETVKRSFVAPTSFFEKMPVDDSDGALSFYWINAGIGTLVGQLWSVVFAAVGIGSPGTPKLPADHPLATYMNTMSSPWWNLIIGLVFAAASPLFLYIYAGLFHLGLMIFKGNKTGFKASLRSVGYASGPLLLQVIPVCGFAIGYIWSLVLTVIGLSKTHRTTTGTAIGAVVLPMVVLICCFCALVVLGGLAIGAGMAGAMNH
jgi:hypothetical protein